MTREDRGHAPGAAPMMAVGDAGRLSARPAGRSAWLKALHRRHWISSELCLVGMVRFAFTGLTLTHAADIGARPS